MTPQCQEQKPSHIVNWIHDWFMNDEISLYKPSVKPEISRLRILPVVRIVMLRCMLCLHSSVIIFIWRPQLRLHRRTRTITIIWLFNQDRIALWSRWWGWSLHRLRLCHSRLCLCLWHHPQTAIMWTSSFLPNDNQVIDRISIHILISQDIPLSMHFQANQNKPNTNLSNYPETCKQLIDHLRPVAKRSWEEGLPSPALCTTT